MTLALIFQDIYYSRKGFYMNETLPKIGFSYFTSPNYQLHSQLSDWLPIMKDFGASSVIFQSSFSLPIQNY